MATTNPAAALTPFTVTYAIGRRTRTWTRFAATLDAATLSAREALDAEYFGKARLLSVEAA